METITPKAKCVICKRDMNDPRRLPCRHYFCNECILKCADKNHVQCPTCEPKKQYPVPKEGFPAYKPIEVCADPDHDGEKTEYYCELCPGGPLCSKCLEAHGDGHDVKGLENAAAEKASALALLQYKLEENANDLMEKLKHLESEKEELQRKIQDTKKAMIPDDSDAEFITNYNVIARNVKQLTETIPAAERFNSLTIENQKPFCEMSRTELLLAEKLQRPPKPELQSYSTNESSWKQILEFSTIPKAHLPTAIAVCGDTIAVTSTWNKVALYTEEGKFKQYLQDSSNDVLDIAVSPSDQYIVPSEDGFIIYSSDGVWQDQIRIPGYGNGTWRQFLETRFRWFGWFGSDTTFKDSIHSVDVDLSGQIILGLSLSGQGRISVYNSDGKFRRQFVPEHAEEMSMCRIACMRYNLCVSLSNFQLQIISKDGYKLETIEAPEGIEEADCSSWCPKYVCCSRPVPATRPETNANNEFEQQEELFVGNCGEPKTVFRYICMNGKFQYKDRVDKKDWNWNPSGIALSADNKKLFVVNKSRSLIRVYKRQ
ncbi:uncharacterized protein [Amphiura filiformis]|uniref:uncharacterized protein n=1 Tax=Amphiura filiformis TaxID=82378 RepID=UPI003B21A4A1